MSQALCTAVICQFDLCCSVTCLRHSLQQLSVSLICAVLWHVSGTLYSSYLSVWSVLYCDMSQALCTAVICQFDLCCTVTCLRHSVQQLSVSLICAVVWHVSGTLYSSYLSVWSVLYCDMSQALCTAVICQFDLCCTVTCLRHSLQQLSVSLICAVLWDVSGTLYSHLQTVHIQSQTQCTSTQFHTINSSSSQFPHTLYCKH